MRFWVRTYNKREVLQAVAGGHSSVPGARSAEEQGIQPLNRHVESGRHPLRHSQRHLPLQRRRGHHRPDTERRIHVPSEPLEGRFQGRFANLTLLLICLFLSKIAVSQNSSKLEHRQLYTWEKKSLKIKLKFYYLMSKTMG